MRAQTLLQFLAQNYRNTAAANLANNQNIRGGWEIWLQVEIALTFVTLGGQGTCEREIAYPSGQQNTPYIAYNPGYNPPAWAVPNPSARCDFYLHRSNGTAQQDDTYIELKCVNPNAYNIYRIDPITDAWNRFKQDIAKIQAIGQVNGLINGIALLATFQQFNQPLPQFPTALTAYIWDPTNNKVSTVAEVKQGAPNRFFMVAVSP